MINNKGVMGLVSLLVICGTALLLHYGTIENNMFLGSIFYIFGGLLLLVIPGRRITEIIFKKGEIDAMEHFGLSILFSLIVVPLVIFYCNVIGVPITNDLLLTVILVIVLLCIVIGNITPKKGQKSNAS